MDIIVHKIDIHVAASFDVALLQEEIQKMTEALDRLKASVANESTVVDSAIALITGLAAELRAAVDAGDSDALNSLADDMDAKSAALAAAVSAGTTPETPVAADTGVKVVGHDTGLDTPNTGAATFDPPHPSANPFDPNASAAAPVLSGETATNVATPPSDDTIAAGLDDATGAPAQAGLSDAETAPVAPAEDDADGKAGTVD